MSSVINLQAVVLRRNFMKLIQSIYGHSMMGRVKFH